MIGLKRNTVSLSEHASDWPSAAAETIKQLKQVFGEAAADIQHVGSTSIVGIQAKPILDIAVAVYQLDDVLPLIPALGANGFIHRAKNDTAAELFFICGDLSTEIITHHIHVVVFNSREWNGYLDFRDFMNAHRSYAEEYEQLKKSLLQKYPNDRLSYTNGKAEFIQNILFKASNFHLLGKIVTVTVDRPLGSTHPKHSTTVYPVNYGFIEGRMAADGEEQDAYILGVNEPVSKFTGRIIAVIHRLDDIETKWVVAPVDEVLYEQDIRDAVSFTERYFNSNYYCLYI
jgi:GrpB-like predicted nucleotidyltransferase (UPF0157 family)